MGFKKSALKKQLEVDEEGFALETIDVGLKYVIQPGQSYDDIRAALISRLDKRFNEMFAAELGIMPERLQEGEVWHQRSMFGDDVINQAASALHAYGAVLGVPRGEDEDEEE